jgi:asparagine synthase (glutamine-hydrolysing)
VAFIAGLVSDEGVAPGPLAARLAQLVKASPRSRGFPVHAATLGSRVLLVAGERDSAYAESTYGAVGLDGVVDNLAELRRAAGLGDGVVGQAAGLLELIAAAGEAVLEQLEGDFSIIMIPRGASGAVLQRDWFGFCPLFYAHVNGAWVFASEMPALVALLGDAALDEGTLSELVSYRWTVGTATAIAGVSQLMPAHIARLGPDGTIAIRQYWRMVMRPEPDGGDPQRWADAAEQRLRGAVRRVAGERRQVWVLLSGGVDSSLLCAIAASEALECVGLSARLVGQPDPELERARLVAGHLGIRHEVVDVTDADVAAAAEVVAARFDQPIMHYHAFVMQRLIARAARDTDLVVYGEAADVLFGSSSIGWLTRFARKRRVVEALPRFFRSAMGALLRGRRRGLTGRASRVVRWSLEDCLVRMDLVSVESDFTAVVRGVEEDPAVGREILAIMDQQLLGWIERRQLCVLLAENRSHLDMVDRLASPYGLRVRAPFLTPGVLELAGRLPTALKTRGDMTKPILKDLACRFLPRELALAPKLGFPTPKLHWLEGPLRPWLRLAMRPGAHLEPYLDRAALAALTLEGDHELIWSVASLEMLLSVLLEQRGSEAGVREILRRVEAA